MFPASDPLAADALDRMVRAAIGRLRVGAALVAVAIALALPAARLYFGLQAKRNGLGVEIEQLVDDLSRRAGSRPDTWAFERNALASTLDLVVRRGAVDAAMLLDSDGRELASAGQWKPDRWMQRRGDVLDSGVPVGTVYLQSASTGVLVGVAQVGMIGLLLAVIVWWLIARVALSSLTRTFIDLQRARLLGPQQHQVEG